MKSIIVTGASGNLGRAVVKRFLADGHTVHAALGLGENTPAFTGASSGQLHTQAPNLTDEAASERFVKDIIAKDQHVDTAVCIVGGWQPGSIAETTAQDIDKMIKLNFSTAFNIVRPLLEFFERQGRGQFVFIGSRPSINPAEGKNQVAYALSKSLVFRLAEIINDQGKTKNIRAGVVVPAVLDTPQNRAAMPDADTSNWVTPEAAADTIALFLHDTNPMRETVVKLYDQAM